MNEDSKRIIGAFLIGGMIGAVAALLYAPKSGRETRRDISKAARRVKKDTIELVEDTIDGLTEFVDDVKEKATDIIDRGVEISEGAKRDIIKAFEQGEKGLEKQKKRIAEALGR